MGTGVSESAEDQVVGRLVDEGSRALAGERVVPGAPAPMDAGDEAEVVAELILTTAPIAAGSLRDPTQSAIDRRHSRLWLIAFAALGGLIVLIGVFIALGGSKGLSASADGKAAPGQPAPQMPAQGAPAQPNPAAPAGGADANPAGAASVAPTPSSPAEAIAAACLVPADQFEVALEDSQWHDEPGNVLGSWTIMGRNLTDKQVGVFVRYASQNSRIESKNRPANAWAPGVAWYGERGEKNGGDSHPIASGDLWQGEYATDCYYDWPDRIVVVYYGACSDPEKPPFKGLSAEAFGALLDQHGVPVPVLGRAQGFTCH
jgi:hypothetical protein